MGADIHIFAERRLKDGTWAMCKQYSPVSAVAFDRGAELTGVLYHRAKRRNYPFFAALAGVRGDGPDPRGLPEDVSPLVMEECDHWGVDGHSHSWYSAEEFAPLFMDHHMTDQERTELVSRKLQATHPYNITAHVLSDYLGIDLPFVDGAEDTSCIRFVFWFDN